MRHIQIPFPVELCNVFDEKKNPVKYGLEQLNKENVWNASKWRDENKIDICLRIAAKFKSSKYIPETYVSLTDEEYENYYPLAMLKGKTINPEMSLEVLQIMSCVQNAPHEIPGEKPVEAKPVEAKQEN